MYTIECLYTVMIYQDASMGLDLEVVTGVDGLCDDGHHLVLAALSPGVVGCCPEADLVILAD